MPGVLTTRLPGVTFDVVAPPPPAVLPRMDIAGVVGFAACGPVGVPVPVEDVGRFRDVFGPDVDLAWDPERDALATSLLGPAVEAFFRNGGRRCWVVRVAGEAATHTVPVPGLWALDGEAPAWADRQPAEARARCPGSWADDLALGTVLRSVGLRPVTVERDGDTVAVEVVRPAQGTLEPGDLVRVAFPGVLLYLFAESVEDVAPASLRVEGAEAVWLAASDDPDLETLLTLGPDALAAATEGEVTTALAAGAEAAGRLRFDVLAWRGQEEAARIADLAFHPDHPRFWARLPSDAALFDLASGRDDDGRALWPEVADPRVPFAGPEAPPRRTLPIGMAVRADAETAAPPTGDTRPETALDRDGLDPFSSALFLDPALASVSSHRLRDRATERTVVQDEPLLALHALFPLDEVTLVAVPDAVHRGWGMTVVRLPDTIPAPTLAPIGEADERGIYPVSWSEVRVPDRPEEAVEAYEVEESTDAGFASASLRYRGADTDAGFEVPDAPAHTLYYRVRAVEGGRVSAWSNTAATVLPPAPFDACRQPPGAPVLATPVDSPPTAERPLAWTLASAEGSPPPDLAFTVERAVDPAFVSTRILLDAVPASTLVRDADAFTTRLALPETGVTYARVRALRDGLAGPWSNTVAFAPMPTETRALTAPDAFDDTALVDVHRALLRFGSARGDAFAVLAVPDHYERDHALAHRAHLVTALGASEERALSFGALYYPWLAVRGPQDAAVRPVPPDGAVLGTYAEVALREGAWIAPANRPIRDVLAVEPADDRAGWSTLFSAQVNTVRPDPRGVRLLSADTLSPDDALRPVHVRRLLSLLRRLALREGAVYAFEPNGPALQRRVFYQFDALLADLFRRGAFAGATPAQAFQVVTGSSVNPTSAIDRGRFVVELRVAPARPLEFLVVRLLQQDAGGLAVDTA